MGIILIMVQTSLGVVVEQLDLCELQLNISQTGG